DNSPMLPHRKWMCKDLQPNLVETIKTSDNEEYSDDEDSEIEISENTLEFFDEADQLIESEWKLLSEKLVKNVLSEKASNMFESYKNSKRLNAYQASVI
ncbi:6529_t:CDS:2, partial [Funneliformis caledonium]